MAVDDEDDEEGAFMNCILVQQQTRATNALKTAPKKKDVHLCFIAQRLHLKQIFWFCTTVFSLKVKNEGRRLNGLLGLSLNDGTKSLLVILLDKTVSVG